MATFDKLAADQRAIIELVLQRGQSYDDLSEMLGMPASRVRGLARDALAELAPSTARRVDGDWRGQVADYLLLQQSGPEATATRGHLRRSEAARAWALSLLDSLDELYGTDERPEVPEPDPDDGGERERTRPRPTTRPSTRPSRERSSPGRSRPSRERPAALSEDPAATVRRRRIAAGAGVLALVLFAVLVFPIGLLTGGDDDESEGTGTSADEQAPTPVGSPIPLQALRNERGEGVAVVAQRGSQRILIVTAAGLEPTEPSENREQPGTAYEVWLYNSRGDALSVGAQVTDQQGNYQGAGPLPGNFEDYRFIDVSRERIDDDTKHSGDSVLRGRLSDLTAAPPEGAEGGAAPQDGTAPQGGATQPAP